MAFPMGNWRGRFLKILEGVELKENGCTYYFICMYSINMDYIYHENKKRVTAHMESKSPFFPFSSTPEV